MKQLNKYLKDKTYSGTIDTYAVLVSHKGKKQYLFSDGTDHDTLFDIASTGKVLVTATLILHLWDEGRLSLSDMLDVFLTMYRMTKQT